jgi:hypothetical protein
MISDKHGQLLPQLHLVPSHLGYVEVSLLVQVLLHLLQVLSRFFVRLLCASISL